jgi:WD40 repeat protein
VINMLLRCLICLFLISVAISPVRAQPPTSDAPYLYYYSGNGFVIERADGSDSRVLGDGLMPPYEYGNFVHAAWSPSGRWLAWTSNSWGNSVSGRFLPVGAANVIRSDGSLRLTTFDSWGGGITLQWAENADLLFAAQQILERFPRTSEQTFSEGMLRMRFALVDVTTGRTLFDVTDSVKSDDWFEVLPVLVHRIGQQFIAEYRIPTSDSWETQRVFRVFGMDGTWYEGKRDMEATQSDEVYRDASLSPDGRRAAQGGYDHQTITDTQTGEVRRVRPPAISWIYGLYSEEFIWHSDSRWLLFSYEGDSSSYYNNFYISVIDTDNGTLRDLALHYRPLPHAANWLPPQVDPATLPPVLDQPPFSRPDYILYGSAFVEVLEWSPDSTRIADVSPFDEWSNQNSIAVWDVASGERVQRIIGVNRMHDIVWEEDERVRLIERTEPEDPDSGVIATSPDGSLIAVVDDDGLRVQDAQTDQVICIILDWNPPQRLHFRFSPDNRTAIFEHSELWDMQTCRVLTRLPFTTSDAEFSPDGRWLATAVTWDIQLWDMEKLLHPYIVGGGE